MIKRKVIQYTSLFLKNFSKAGNSMPILINSVPKSGTHLVEQLFNNFEPVKNYNFFIAQQPTQPFRIRSQKKINNMIKKIKMGELLRGHIYYSAETLNKLKKQNCLILFIYRDPRDIVISEANYLTKMNTLHRAHKFFKLKDNQKDQIKLAISGIQSNKIDYSNVFNRLNPYSGWLLSSSKNIFPIKYEDLRNNIDKVLNDLYKFLDLNDYFFDCSIEKDTFIKQCKSGINPKKSHTFNKGKTGSWKEIFDEELSQLFKENSKDLLEKFNYKN